MVDSDLVAAKLSDLAMRVSRVRIHRKDTAVALGADPDALDLVSFNLMLAVQICADVASHLIADEGWPAAGSLADSFGRLASEGVIREETAEVLKRAVGLRNVVAHGYGRVDPTMVHAASQTGLDDLGAFAREVSAWISAKQRTGA
jgi:uncharacterized protein YutE (UPF0331/DUF86 family)